MSRITLTRELAFAASLDAGNRSMKAAGRKTWSKHDQLEASREFQRLWPRCEHGIEPEEVCFYCDETPAPATRTPSL